MFPFEEDFQQVIKDNLLSIWNGSRTAALTKAIADELRTIEDEVFGTKISMDPETATGEHLEKWGSFVNEARGSLNDVELRKVVRTKAAALFAGGTVPELIDALSIFADSLRAVPQFPAALSIEMIFGEPLTDSARDRIKRFIDIVVPAGVRTNTTEGTGTVFRVDSGKLDSHTLARKL